MANCKTPVSILQELCAKKGVTPVYDTIGQEGASHQPKFTIRCTAGDVVGNGQGSSKKVAKQSAAEDVLQQLDVEVPAVEDEGRSLKDNPVGELQELVTLLGWRKPEYEALEESGPPHNRRFVIAVSVDKYKEQGVDQSKRLAKRAAATTMLEVLHKLPADINPGLINRKPKQKHPKMPGPHRLAIKNLPQAEGNFIRSLKMNALNFPDPSYSSMLQDLGQEQSFKVEHVPIEEQTKAGHYQCFVRLHTAPVTVCFANGLSRNDAMETASHNALQYLKVMATKVPAPAKASAESNGQMRIKAEPR
ncbi:RISC-loading complex subunit tarbp2-like [Lytechinus variegatus]|uniref:RISC-loading complex subunit tarbp2-like n=1 Tax=Lytechinus variegatus TaxID=7654 RepID=UPI001BB0F640|nr:RISC-loading complex subunit tarbp2-like [Lytechinus variegatus]